MSFSDQGLSSCPDSMFVPHNSNSVTQLVIVDSTSTYRLDGTGAEAVDALYRIPGIDSAAVHDYEARNLEPHSLRHLATFGLQLPVVLATRDSLRVVPGEGAEKYWSRFYQRYPHSGGSITLSAIGYNVRGDVAILWLPQLRSCASRLRCCQAGCGRWPDCNSKPVDPRARLSTKGSGRQASHGLRASPAC